MAVLSQMHKRPIEKGGAANKFNCFFKLGFIKK